MENSCGAIRKQMRASTQNFFDKSKRTPPTTRTPLAGLEACQSGWTFPAFA
jgi:hypothetical protein